jgi:predicted HTH domain antitoxin
MSTQVTLEFPSDLPDEGLHDPEVMEKGKQAIVLELLRKGTISQRRAAELLEIDRNALFDLMAAQRIPTFNMTAEDLRTELSKPLKDPTIATAGAWKGLLDCEQFEEEVYQSRLHAPRPEVRL